MVGSCVQRMGIMDESDETGKDRFIHNTVLGL